MVPDPVFRVGFLPIHPFGLSVALAIAVSSMVGFGRIVRGHLSIRLFPGLCLVLPLGGLATAHLSYLLAHTGLLNTVAGTLSLWRGGFNLAGGIVGGSGILLLYTWAHREPFWPWADALAPAAAFGITVGLLGLPSGGEGWGEPTTGPFFTHVSSSLLPPSLINEAHFQPIFAYDLLFFGGLTAILFLFSARRSSRSHGPVGLVFFSVSLIGCALIEPLTLDADHPVVILLTQLICAAAASSALVSLYRRGWEEQGRGATKPV